jgi:hypothetical protein
VRLIPLVDSQLSTATSRPPLVEPPHVDPHLSTSRLSAAIHLCLCSNATHLSDLGTRTRTSSRLSAAIHLYPPQLASVRRNSLMSPSFTRRRRRDRYTTIHRRTVADGTPVRLIPLADPHLSTATCRPALVDPHLSTPTCRRVVCPPQFTCVPAKLTCLT